MPTSMSLPYLIKDGVKRIQKARVGLCKPRALEIPTWPCARNSASRARTCSILQLERGTRKNMHAWPCLSKYVKVILAKEQPWAVPHEGSFYIQCPWPKAVMAMGCHGPWDVNWSSLLIFSHFTHSTSTTSLNFTDFTLKGRDVKQKGKMTLLRQGVEFGHWTLTCSGYLWLSKLQFHRPELFVSCADPSQIERPPTQTP